MPIKLFSSSMDLDCKNMLLEITLIATLVLLLAMGLKKGFIGLAGATVYRKEQPRLFWAQMILLFTMLSTYIVVIVIDSL